MTEQLLLPIALAGGLAILASVLVWWRDRYPDGARGLLLAFAYTAGHCPLAPRPYFPPLDAVHWLPFLALAAGALVAISERALPPELRPSVFALLSLGAFFLLLSPKFQAKGLGEEKWLVLIPLAGLALLMGRSLLRVSSHPAWYRAEPALLLLLLAGTTAAGLMATGSLLLGVFACILCAALLGSLPQVARREGMPSSVLAVASLLLLGLLACGQAYSSLPLTSALLLGIAPAAFAGMRRLLHASSPKRSFLAPWHLTALIIVVALALALGSSPF